MAVDQAILQVADLSVSFVSSEAGRGHNFVHVVNGISFEVGPRETVALVGGSGSGKSVTSLAVMRLLDAKRSKITGSVRLHGRELLDLPEPAMRAVRGNSVSMIFQEPMTSLNPVISVGQQVSEILVAHRGLSRAAARARAAELLDRVQIPSAASRLGDFPHQFSGGQLQRVLIAMALACDPDVLIADEPTTALDVTVQAQILDLIRELQAERGMSVLFITHDMGVVAEVADRMVVMHKGQIVETGATGDVFADPAQPYTKALLAAIPRLGSMAGRPRPMRFPHIDKATGVSVPGAELADTVDTTGAKLLTVKNLVKRYSGPSRGFRGKSSPILAVNDISFDVRPGETLALVGESGCGKSTTGRTIIRLQDPTSGEILFDGADMTSLNGSALRERRSYVQMIFQDPYASLNPRMTIGNALAEPIIAHHRGDRRTAERRAAELLELVGLDPDASARLPREFSGGQRQRISIARALTLDAKLLIADEAVSALDVLVKAQIVNLLLDLQERLRLAYLFISHDMAVVERISHRVAVMRAGEIVEIGPRAEIFERPQHPYTRSLLAAAPLPDPSRRLRPPSKGRTGPPSTSHQPAGPRRLREVGPEHFVLT